MTARPFPRRVAASALAFGLLLPAGAGTAHAAVPADLRLLADGQCEFGGKPLAGKPWALQRILLDQLWTKATGKGVVVAVIDSGVDTVNPQLAGAVVPGKDFLPGAKGPDGKDLPDGKGLVDTNGHGTMAAGIIAARPGDTLKPKVDTGFSGIAKEAQILPVRQNGGDEATKGNTDTLAQAIDYAVGAGAKIINISQAAESSLEPAPLRKAVDNAVAKGVLIVVAAGNSGDKTNGDTWPAKMPGVLAVGASDRNNDRAAFSQNKDYVGVLGPGVDMWSTVPKGGHCATSGTSFSAPYVAGVAALIRGLHPDWSPQQVITAIEQTAQRTVRGKAPGLGWGVVDPLKAVEAQIAPGQLPKEDPPLDRGDVPVVVEPLHLGPTRAEKDRKTGTAVMGIGLGVALILVSGAFVLRDARARRLP